MISFRQFFTEGTYKLSDSERSEITLLSKEFINRFSKHLPTKETKLGGIVVDNLETGTRDMVSVVVSPSAKHIGGKFNEDTKTITIFVNDSGLISADRVFDMIAHEVYHAKQQYKKAGDEYEPYSPEKEKEHFMHPTEYPVYVSTLIDAINRYHVSITDKLYSSEGSVREMWKRKKEEFMLFLKLFLKAGGELPEELKVPDVLKRFEKFIRFLINNKNDTDVHTKFQKFFRDVYKTYMELKEYDER